MTWIALPDGAWDREKNLARAALAGLSPQRVDSFDTVRVVGRVLHGVSPDLYPEWSRWASAHPAYTPEYCTTVWTSFDMHPGKPVTLGLLISFVRKDTGDAAFGKRGGA